MKLPPLSLYVHIPWCTLKCPYCDFNSHTSKTIDEPAYIKQLEKDLLQDQHWVNGRKLHSIFFGGGTPSLFSAHSIEKILQFAEKRIGFEDNIEITLEANPGSAEQDKFSGFFHAGVNRLSIGIQSFNEHHLKTLVRIHDCNEAKKAITIAKHAGFTNINCDLIHGLPHQTTIEATNDLQTLIDFEPQHISWYQLTIEPNTYFYRQTPPLPVDDILEEIQLAGMDLLEKNNFTHYEVSAFCQPGRASKHNSNYWEFGDYIGIGAGAHGKFTDVNNQQVLRRQKTRIPTTYLDKVSFKENPIEPDALTLEFMMNALRLRQGVPSKYFEERTGLSLKTIDEKRQRLQTQGLMKKNPQQLCTSTRGFAFLNSVLSEFD